MVKAIELATSFEIQVIERPVYRVRGAHRDYFSERAALNKLSNMMATQEFHDAGVDTNYPDIKTQLEDGTPTNKRGERKPEFIQRKSEILDELCSKLKREREIQRLEMEYKKAKDKRKDADIEVNEAHKKLIAVQNL
ncbi:MULTISPECIES: hypothetical protein [unclassified Providencia]|uniref:hypothetical protein n=2 Tax=Providencia TaxID=586 RepID=UPI00234BEC25|nr:MULTISPECIES: hypothetical protein [unclassified Providencia]